MITTEQQLIEASQAIGAISGSNSAFTYGLALLVDATGKNIQDMTVCELLHLANDYREIFNRVHAA